MLHRLQKIHKIGSEFFKNLGIHQIKKGVDRFESQDGSDFVHENLDHVISQRKVEM